MFFVYLIKCQNPNNLKKSYYCGYTNNPERRKREHFGGTGAKYTKSFSPIEMRIIDKYKTRKEAMSNERLIKKMNKKIKIKLFNNSNFSIKK